MKVRKVQPEKLDKIASNSLHLEPCRQCGCDKGLLSVNFEYYGIGGAFVQCQECKYSTRRYPIRELVYDDFGRAAAVATKKAVFNAMKSAADEWNEKEEVE